MFVNVLVNAAERDIRNPFNRPERPIGITRRRRRSRITDRVKAVGNDRALPLDQRGNGPALGGDEAVDLGGVGVEEIGDPPLLPGRGRGRQQRLEILPVETVPIRHDPARGEIDLAHVGGCSKQVGVEPRLDIIDRSGDNIGGADQPIAGGDADRALPHPHDVVGDIALGGALVFGAVGHLLLATALHVADPHARPQRYLQDRQFGKPGLIAFRKESTVADEIPMGGHFWQPIHATVAILGIGLQCRAHASASTSTASSSAWVWRSSASISALIAASGRGGLGL